MTISPTTAAVLTMLSSVVSAAGSIAQGQATAAQSRFQAAVARQRAQRERQVAAAEEEDFRRRQQRLMAKRRAALGGAGVVGGTGSPLLVSEDIAAETEFQALRIRSGGKTRATRLEQQARLFGAKGRSARRAGFLKAGTSLLAGAGRSAIILDEAE